MKHNLYMKYRVLRGFKIFNSGDYVVSVLQLYLTSHLESIFLQKHLKMCMQ